MVNTRSQQVLRSRLIRLNFFFEILKQLRSFPAKLDHKNLVDTFIPHRFVIARYYPGGEAYFTCALNSFVHVVMYSYYLWSALASSSISHSKPTWTQPVSFFHNHSSVLAWISNSRTLGVLSSIYHSTSVSTICHHALSGHIWSCSPVCVSTPNGLYFISL